jgi:exopolyphosphatase/guanosine-5'-triphosphate,3'-diphosphate pyrophosphatase
VLGHRGKLDLERMRLWYPNLGPAALRLAVLLRLAARLHRSRSPTRAMEPGLTVVPEGLCMRVPGGFLDVHPLTRADLAEEEVELKAVGIRLIVE